MYSMHEVNRSILTINVFCINIPCYRSVMSQRLSGVTPDETERKPLERKTLHADRLIAEHCEPKCCNIELSLRRKNKINCELRCIFEVILLIIGAIK